jgi:hypothetical protein
MQTFLPYSDFWRTARCLDNRRLGKQRIEALQIIRALSDSSYGWQNHPAVRQWIGYRGTLASYGETCAREWLDRGYADSLLDQLQRLRWQYQDTEHGRPWWLDHELYHASHRAALLFKDPAHYSQFGWTETPQLRYFWPSKEKANV